MQRKGVQVDLTGGWGWLTQPEKPYTWGFALRVLGKAAILFTVFNALFALLDPLPALGNVSLYNRLLPGRERLSYSDVPPDASYSLTFFNLDALFAAHAVAAPKAADEYRVVLVGDSAVWGYWLKPEETLAAYLNAANLTLDDGRRVRTYNLGYPRASLMKDLLVMDYARRYDPDMIVWMFSLLGFPSDRQLFSPILEHNPGPARRLLAQYGLNLEEEMACVNDYNERWQPSCFDLPATFGEKTLVGRRRALADLLRLQLYGVNWAATGIDYYLDEYEDRREPPPQTGDDIAFCTLTPETFTEDKLAFDVLRTGVAHADAGTVPLLLVNEPMYISPTSAAHYNAYYPRWIYDGPYHATLVEMAAAERWHLLDLWDAIDNAQFSDTPLHLTPEGARQLGDIVGPAVVALANETH